MVEDAKFVPVIQVDLDHISTKTFLEAQDEFFRLTKDRGMVLPKNALSTGWQEITPAIAELLLLSRSNRKISLDTVRYYAAQMKSGEWKRTGQPILVSEHGDMLDAFHRCWASYLGRVSFPSYVITGIEAVPNLFAYIDNSKARTLADALYTAGLNGISQVLSSTIKMAITYEYGAYTPRGTAHIGKISPKDGLSFAQHNPSMGEIVHLIMGEHQNAVNLFAAKDVVCFVSWKISQLHGEDVLDDFLSEVENSETESPQVMLLRKRMKANLSAEKRLPKRDVLAFAIMTFNAWHEKRALRSLKLATDDMFPKFVGEEETQLVAAQ